jgi:two-component system, NtrC family, sensor kinase
VNIRSKVAALLAVIFAILGVAAFLVAQYVIMPSFAGLEREDAHTAMRRVNYALEESIGRLAVAALDWGNWSDTYQFVLDHNRKYVAANLTRIGLHNIGVNVFLVIDRKGNVVQASEIDLESERPLGLDLTARKMLRADFPWRAQLENGGVAQGLLPSNLGPLMVAAAPILDGDGHGPSRGMVLLGRLLSSSVVSDVGQQAQAPVTLLAPSSDHVSGEQLVEDTSATRVYRVFDDIYGKPILTLRVDVPRSVTQRGYAAAYYAAAYLAGAALLVLGLLIAALNRLILSPLAIVTRHAVAVGKEQDLTTRLDLSNSDEIGVLAREFDRMVTRVAESRTQLVDQSYQAGLAELAKGVLHNLGNAMTPIGVRLANVSDRLRRAPVEDAEEAVAELRGGTTDTERRADLEEFVRLACGELAHAVKASREDLAVMQRQTAVVQTALSEQSRTARNEQVIEPVRLSELIVQSLEVVPDACRQRLTIESDASVRRAGVVRLARTVLRLVLQNLIINAADAVRDAGRQKGRLSISAEITDGEVGRRLHLHCRDDGVGIPAENLARVFEKGFSTKSRETNQGIGLHWCANAVNALGGRIWAESEGPGRGAVLHVEVPLVAAAAATAASATAASATVAPATAAPASSTPASAADAPDLSVARAG